MSWFKSFLSNRIQIIKHKNFVSNQKNVTSGVPQRNYLSPFIFSIFTNDLPKVIAQSKILLFTDDMKKKKIKRYKRFAK